MPVRVQRRIPYNSPPLISLEACPSESTEEYNSPFPISVETLTHLNQSLLLLFFVMVPSPQVEIAPMTQPLYRPVNGRTAFGGLDVNNGTFHQRVFLGEFYAFRSEKRGKLRVAPFRKEKWLVGQVRSVYVRLFSASFRFH